MSDRVEKARDRLNRRIMAIEGVVGTALGMRDGTPCIKVYVETDDPELRAGLPRSAGGVPVEVEATGRIERW